MSAEVREEEGVEEEERYVEGDVERVREVFEPAYKDLKSRKLKEEVRVFLFLVCAAEANPVAARYIVGRMEGFRRGAWHGRRREDPSAVPESHPQTAQSRRISQQPRRMCISLPFPTFLYLLILI